MTKTPPNKIQVYSFIVDTMKEKCNHQTCQKLDLLKRKIEQGFNSPQTESLNIFGVNLFVYDYHDYLAMYEYLNGSLT